MKISLNTTKNFNKGKEVSFKGFYNNKLLLKSLEFASNNCALFTTTVGLGFSMARPLAIWATPKTDKNNKKIACTKSIASNITGYLMMLACSIPIAHSVKKIDKNPGKYLTKTAIKNLKEPSKKLVESTPYLFSTKLIKLGQGLALAIPKSILTCALMVPIMGLLIKKPKQSEQQSRPLQKAGTKHISFKGLYNTATNGMAKFFGKIISTKKVQKLAKNFSNTNYEQHTMNLTDIAATWAFIHQNNKSKEYSEKRKKILNKNSIYATAMSIIGGYAINSLTEKPTQKFLEKFIEVNKNSPKLSKYNDGFRVAKPTFILGFVYYVIIPVLSTFFAERTIKD